MDLKNVVAYCRVSTDGQTGDGKYGLDAQREAILEYCYSHDMRVSEWYVDEGESGVTESRPQLDRLLFGDIANPPVEAVIVYKSDRMARETKLYFYYMMLLEKRGIELISATEPIVDDETGLGSVYRALVLFVAEQERKNIMRRTAGGRAQKASRGGYSGGRAPYGYSVANKALVVNPSEAEAVRRIFKLRSAGKTFMQIAETLGDEGYTTRAGGAFYASNIKSIVDNQRTYQGWYRYGKNGAWVKGQHEAILEG